MSQQPAEESLLLTLDPEQPSAPIPGTPPLIDAAEPTTDPLVTAGTPADSSNFRRKLFARVILGLLLAITGFLLVTVLIMVGRILGTGIHYALEQLKVNRDEVSFWV